MVSGDLQPCQPEGRTQTPLLTFGGEGGSYATWASLTILSMAA